MSVVLPQPGARTSAAAALVVVGGGVLLVLALIEGTFAVASAHALMNGPISVELHEAPPAPRPPR
jgi:hypothetical protein